jgi:SET domain
MLSARDASSTQWLEARDGRVSIGPPTNRAALWGGSGMGARESVGRAEPLFVAPSAVDGLGLFSRRSFSTKDVISDLEGDVSFTPSKRSIQIARGRHFYNRYVDYLNHSCTPASYIAVGDDGSVRLVALRAITRDSDEITINYNHSEYRLTSPFTCKCCPRPRIIRGYRYEVEDADEESVDHLDEYALPHLRELTIEEFGARTAFTPTAGPRWRESRGEDRS